MLPSTLQSSLVLLLAVATTPLAVATTPLRPEAQATTCATPAGPQQYMLGRIRKLMVTTDPAVIAARNRVGISFVNDTTKIVWVTDNRICDKVHAAYAAYLAAKGATRAVGAQVFVVKVGSAFVVQDTYVSPDSEWAMQLVMDKQYKVISATMT